MNNYWEYIYLINNNIALRNQLFVGINRNSIVFTSSKFIYSFLDKNGYKCKLFSRPNFFLRTLFIFSNNPILSNTVILKKKYVLFSHSRLYNLLNIFLIKKFSCENLILSSCWETDEIIISLKIKSKNKVGYVNSWDNPSSRNLYLKNIKKLFVWSNYVKDTVELFYPKFSGEIIITGRYDKFNIKNNKKNNYILFIHGGRDSDILKHSKLLRSYCDENNLKLYLRAYGDVVYKKETLVLYDHISKPDGLNIGGMNSKTILKNLNDHDEYYQLINDSNLVFTQMSTAILDIMRLDRTPIILYDSKKIDEFKILGYHHILHLLLKSNALTHDINEVFNNNLDTSNPLLRESSLYFNGE